jgi:hypothetical protein
MKQSRVAALMVVSATAFVILSAVACSGDDSLSRQDEVAQRGATVMPFDLNKTHHTFEQNATGGVETVHALDAKDAAQIDLIRSHLQLEARKFAAGDFSDPTAIHGDRMPGVAALSAGANRLKIDYAELPDGAKITYASEDPLLVAAIHDWFDAQVSDHGQHASSH